MDHLGEINMENVIVKNLKSFQILQHLLRTSSFLTVKLLSGFAWKWDVLKGCTDNFQIQSCLYMCMHSPTLPWKGSWHVLGVGCGLTVLQPDHLSIYFSYFVVISLGLARFDSRVHREFTHSAVAWHYSNVWSLFCRLLETSFCSLILSF